MSRTINDYFQKEMQLLNESVQYYAKNYPEQAANLGLDSFNERDPHMERLLEGCAYLTARTKQQIDLGIHNLSEPLLRRLAPQYLVPQASKTMVEFSCPQKRLAQSESLPSGLQLISEPVGEEQTVCTFVTTQELNLHPMTLESFDKITEGSDRLQLFFKLNEGVNPASIDLRQLPLFINAPLDAAMCWHYYLTRCVNRVVVKFSNNETACLGGQTMISEGERIHREDRNILTEFFHFPEQFFILNINFDQFIIKRNSFVLEIEFSKPLYELRLSSQLFKLYCVPAVNLFPTQGEPIRYHQSRRNYPFLVKYDKPDSVRLHSVKKVTGVDKYHSEITTLLNFHKVSDSHANKGCYRLTQSHEQANWIRNELIFSGAMSPEMYISTDVLAFNAHYPRQFLHAQALFLKNNQTSAHIHATNLSRPTHFYHPVFDRSYALNVLSFIQAGFQKFSDVQFLQQLLRLHDVSGHARLLIEGIRRISLQPFNRIQKGVFVRGVLYQLVVADKAATLAELNFFGGVFFQMLLARAPLNSLVEFTIKTCPSEHALNWSQ